MTVPQAMHDTVPYWHCHASGWADWHGGRAGAGGGKFNKEIRGQEAASSGGSLKNGEQGVAHFCSTCAMAYMTGH